MTLKLSLSLSLHSEAMEKEQNKLELPVWDSGSTLYDSFELHSFKRHLDSAIASRSFSLRQCSTTDSDWPRAPLAKASKRISLSVRRFLRSVFTTKSNAPAPESPDIQKRRTSVDGRSRLCRQRGRLDTQKGYGDLPELGSFVRRTVSERFTANSIGILCSWTAVIVAGVQCLFGISEKKNSLSVLQFS